MTTAEKIAELDEALERLPLQMQQERDSKNPVEPEPQIDRSIRSHRFCSVLENWMKENLIK